jgi:ABC-type branched-subunit amino acid transport system ATPase component/ABC-type branched-subunit amino acid transport system permease subunit
MSTGSAIGGALRDVRVSWRPRASIAVAAFAVASTAPLVAGEPRTVDLANGLYLACAAIALALVVGVAGLPSLAQGAYVAIGAIVGAHLLAHGVPTLVTALLGGGAGAVAGGLSGFAFARLPRAGFAAATWILAWLVAFAAQSVTWVVGGSQGTIVVGGPSPTVHYELALCLTGVAALAFSALARAPFGLGLAAARGREGAARALGLPVTRLRTGAIAAAAAVGGLTGALSVELAGVADPAAYGPYLSFKLFVVVLIGGAVAPLGAPLGVLALGALSVAADAVGSVENVAAARSHTLLAAIMLLGLVSLGWEGILRPATSRRRAAGPPPPRPPRAGLGASQLRKRYGDLVAVDSISLGATPGTITALVGPNGSGKTTVLRMLAGAVSPDSGSIDGGDLAVRTPQATAVFAALTPLEHVLVGSARRRRRGGLVRSLLATPQHRREDAAFVAEAEAILERFGLPRDAPAGELPAGDQRLLMLAAAYATGAPVLLVDEPTAGASVTEAARVTELLRELRAEGLAVIVVEHNLGVVRSLADRVVVLDAGRVIADGVPDLVAADQRVRAAFLGRQSL